MNTKEMARRYDEMLGEGYSSSSAAHSIDYGIAYEAAKRKLRKQGLRREPTDWEVQKILEAM